MADHLHQVAAEALNPPPIYYLTVGG